MPDQAGCLKLSPPPLPPGAILGEAPRTAFRVRPDRNGQVWLEQLGHSHSAGWHVQKSLAIPAGILPAMLRELRKADCLTPRPARSNLTPNVHLRLRLTD